MKNIVLYFACFLIFLICGCQTQNDNFISQLALPLSSPFQNIKDDEVKELEFNAEEGKAIQLASGSSIVVKPNSFLDSKGNVVKGNVKLQYKEFSSAADIVTSGIPMIFQDQNGENQNMQSAGMFEIKGTANGEEISIAEDKPLEVNMASEVSGKYDFFFLQEEKDKLASKGSVFPAAVAQSASLPEQKYKWVKLTKDKKEHEEEADEKDLKKTTFNLKFDSKSYPETKFLDSLTWAYSGEDETDNPFAKENKWVLNEKWDGVEIGKPVYGSVRIKKEVLKNSSHPSLTAISENAFEIRIDEKDYKINNAVYGELCQDNILVYGVLNKNLNHLDSLTILDIDSDKKIYIPIDIENFYNDNYGNTISQSILSFNYKEDKFAVRSKSSVSIFDLKGNLLKTSEVFKDIRDIKYLPYKDQFILIELENGIKVWDWKNDKLRTTNIPGLGYEDKDDSQNRTYFRNFSENYPVLILRDDQNKFYLFNWETSIINDLDIKDSIDIIYFIKASPAVYTYQYAKNEVYSNARFKNIYDLSGKLIYSNPSKERAAVNSIGRKYPAPFVVIDSISVHLFAPSGTKTDLKKTDAFIKYVYPAGNTLLTFSSNNILSSWDANGKIKNRFPVDPVSEKSFLFMINDTLNIIPEEGNVRIIDTTGAVLSEFSRTRFFSKDFNTIDEGRYLDVEEMMTYSTWKINKSYKLPANVHRLSLYNDTSEFHTYFYGDKKTLSAIDDYKMALKQRLKKAKEAKDNENKLIRSFEISKFGIYNWDIFYDKTNVITLKVNFEMDNDSFNLNTTAKQVFLITGQDRNVVVKNPDYVWDKFQFNPKDPNMLLMVLPDNRIAILSEEEFSRINVQELTKTGKYTFKLKVLDRIQSKEQLDNILKSNMKVNS